MIPGGFTKRSVIGPDHGYVSAETVVGAYVPPFLMLFFTVAVIVWLLVLAVSGPRSSVRAIRSELRALGAFTIIGACIMLWVVIGATVLFKLNDMEDIIPLFVVLEFVWGWFLVAALALVWIWEAVWAKAAAPDAAARKCSIQSLELDLVPREDAADVEPINAPHKDLDEPRLSLEDQRTLSEVPRYTLPSYQSGYSPVRTDA